MFCLLANIAEPGAQARPALELQRATEQQEEAKGAATSSPSVDGSPAARPRGAKSLLCRYQPLQAREMPPRRIVKRPEEAARGASESRSRSPRAAELQKAAQTDAPRSPKRKAAQQPRSRNWCFAASPVTKDTLDALASLRREAQVKYMVVGFSVCQTAQMPFLSGYVEFGRQFREADVKQRPVPNSWRWTARRESATSAAARCKQGGQYVEHGLLSVERLKTRKKKARPAPAEHPLKVAAERIRRHRSWRAVLEDRELKTTVPRHLRWAREVFEASRSDSAAEKPDACAIGWQRAVLTFVLGTAAGADVHWFAYSTGERHAAEFATYLKDHVGAFSVSLNPSWRTSYRGESICVASASAAERFFNYPEVELLTRKSQTRGRASDSSGAPGNPPHVLVFAPHQPTRGRHNKIRWHVVNLDELPPGADVERVFPRARFPEVRAIWAKGDPLDDFLRPAAAAPGEGDAGPRADEASSDGSTPPSCPPATARPPQQQEESSSASAPAVFPGAQRRPADAIHHEPCWECLDEEEERCPVALAFQCTTSFAPATARARRWRRASSAR